MMMLVPYTYKTKVELDDYVLARWKQLVFQIQYTDDDNWKEQMCEDLQKEIESLRVKDEE